MCFFSKKNGYCGTHQNHLGKVLEIGIHNNDFMWKGYGIYPKCSVTLTPYHTDPKIRTTLFNSLLMCLNNCRVNGK